MRTKVLHVARGALMGCAEVIPGVSGGTIALIVGIYERLLNCMRAAVSAAVAVVRRDREAAREAWARLDWSLLVPLGIGMVVAVLVGASIIPPLIDRFPEGTSALFFGLILASLVVPYRMMRSPRAVHALIALGAAVVAFVLTSFPEREVSDPSLLVVFPAAALAICALTLPGVSGSYLLLAMGLYAPTLEAVDSRDLVYVAVFGAGAITGLALFARILGHLLDTHRDATLAALLGLMIGALRAVWPWTGEDNALAGPPSTGDALTMLAVGLAGMAIVFGLLLAERLGKKQDFDEAGTLQSSPSARERETASERSDTPSLR
jgi:putative membrane protein